MNRDELQAENIAKALKDGPRLRTDYNTWIVARDPEKGKVLVGGLGAMGVGQMWTLEHDAHKDYPGYNDAPIQEAGDF